jgi:phosphomannomutase/phosphoglucomutase
MSLSALLADVPRNYNTPEIRVACPDEVKFEIVSKITAEFKRQSEVIDVDGGSRPVRRWLALDSCL